MTGRLKDVLIVRGMKHYPQDLEQTAEQHPVIRPGCTAAFATENGSLGDRIAIVAEADIRQLNTPDAAQSHDPRNPAKHRRAPRRAARRRDARGTGLDTQDDERKAATLCMPGRLSD